MAKAVLPPCCFTWGQTMVGIMKIMATSFKMTCACTVVFSALTLQQSTGPTPLLETPGHSQANLVQSLVGTLYLSPGSWCTQSFVCTLQASVSPVLWKFCNQIQLASKLSPFARSPGRESVVGTRTFLTVWEFLWYNCSAVFRYADDTTLMGGSTEELKSFLMRVKEESERACSRVNIKKKIRSRHPAPLLHDKFHLLGLQDHWGRCCSLQKMIAS